MAVDRIEDDLAQPAALQKVTKVEDRGLVGNTLGQPQPGKFWRRGGLQHRHPDHGDVPHLVRIVLDQQGIADRRRAAAVRAALLALEQRARAGKASSR